MHLERWLSSDWSSELTPLNIYLVAGVDLPSTYTGTGCSLSILIQYQGREAERPPGPAGIIYINYQFMQSFSAHNNLPLVRWCISKKFQHLEFKLPNLSPLPDKK